LPNVFFILFYFKFILNLFYSVIKDDFVSRIHATFKVKNDEYFIEDNSSNGIFLNNVKVIKEAKLK
jgi:pSer/pThr/pTyr-binding forkhead associated (FHA) protein